MYSTPAKNIKPAFAKMSLPDLTHLFSIISEYQGKPFNPVTAAQNMLRQYESKSKKEEEAPKDSINMVGSLSFYCISWILINTLSRHYYAYYWTG